MANVTDAAFRRVIAKYGKPDVMWTEFVSCDGLCSEGRERLLPDLAFTDSERPIVAQFFGAKPETFYQCAQLAQELKFDGIDINMGCPDRNVEKQGAGAALIKTPELAQEIIRETMRGAGDLPVSVKTRIGYNSIALSEWMKYLLDTGLSAITIHARTRKEMSDVPARWDTVKQAAEIAHAFDASPDRTLIFGNGDVTSIEEAGERVRETGADGVMIGRGIFGNPWLFDRTRTLADIPLEERLSVMLEHTFLFEQLFRGTKSFDVMKKHYKAYIQGFDGAKEFRAELMTLKDAASVAKAVKARYPGVTLPGEKD